MFESFDAISPQLIHWTGECRMRSKCRAASLILKEKMENFFGLLKSNHLCLKEFDFPDQFKAKRIKHLAHYNNQQSQAQVLSSCRSQKTSPLEATRFNSVV